jgi:hypothetical protein
MMNHSLFNFNLNKLGSITIDAILAALRRRLPGYLGRLVPKRRFLSCSDHCGVTDLSCRAEQVLAKDYEGHRAGGDLAFDWSAKHTTPDQFRIENELGRLQYAGTRTLHVGIGNSKFAERWHSEMAEVLGITIAPMEKRHADGLSLPNYSCFLMNKYDPAIACLTEGLDFIVDNNPSFAACCKFHFFTMWNSYKMLLKPGGMVLTDTAGMEWVIPGGDLRWSLDDSDISWIADRFGFEVVAGLNDCRVRLLIRKD